MISIAIPALTSLLWLDERSGQRLTSFEEDPPFFGDLAIDRILDDVTKGYEAYELRPLYSHVPHDPAVIDHRQDVLADIAIPDIRELLTRFGDTMRAVREQIALAEKSNVRHQRAARLVNAAIHYCTGLETLFKELKAAAPNSAGLSGVAVKLGEYLASSHFKDLNDGAQQCRKALDSVRYTVLIRGGTVTVRDFVEEPDYNAIIAEFFDRFRQGKIEKHKLEIPRSNTMNHIEAEILHGVAKLNHDTFAILDAFIEVHQSFVDPLIAHFDREVQFYLSWLAFIDRLSATGLSFCRPELIENHLIYVQEGFDLALAEKLRAEGARTVTNDYELRDSERIFVVTGPNQGGKTTFARMIGQMHYFANLGMTVPGRQARLKLYDRIFTHFEREEALITLRGKLHDDLVRIRDILEAITPDSIVILNEIFNSTALRDARFLADAVLRKIIARGSIGVCITFMDELASLGPETVSLTSMVQPDNPAERTFQVIRRKADGLAYALSIAEKYGLTLERLRERLS
jgi:hypothetical protein